MSKIANIRTIPSEQYVYDPCCDSPHSYLSNGLVSHNCVLWVDEIEKGLSGTGSSNFSDGGTLSRVFGTLLTAMEERMEGVVIIATANDISALPPELIRRFTEIFFTDLPVDSEREDIFNIHLRKKKRDAKELKLDMKALVGATEGYTGSEIEKAVKEAIARAFQDGRRPITTADLIGAIEDTKPISRIMADKITKIRDWARGKARYASSLAEKGAARPVAVGTQTSTDDLGDMARPGVVE